MFRGGGVAIEKKLCVWGIKKVRVIERISSSLSRMGETLIGKPDVESSFEITTCNKIKKRKNRLSCIYKRTIMHNSRTQLFSSLLLFGVI